MTTKDGYEWTAAKGLQAGLPCAGVYEDSSGARNSSPYDVIVVGAGFAGLIASRDLTVRGMCDIPSSSSIIFLKSHVGLKVLLLEARDRIGGRAWTSVVNDFSYEMGAAWLLWNQPHVFSQLSRYGMKDEIKATFDLSDGVNVSDMNYVLGDNHEETYKEMSHEDEEAIYQKPAELYFNVDGAFGKRVMPFPQIPFYNPEILKYDNLTAFERLEQIRDELNPLECAALEAYLLLMSGGTSSNTGFLDMLHWWAMCNYGSDGVGSYGNAFKLRCGTTGLAMRIFEDAQRSDNFTTKFSSPVQNIKESEGRVTITCDGGGVYSAAKVISTIPLNVLKTITFDPPLSVTKSQALNLGHVGMHSKIHFEARGTELKSWSGYSYPGHGLLYAYGDETTPVNTTHIVAFGASFFPLHGEDDIERTKAALLDMRKDIKIERVLFHNWVRDPFSKGSWCTYRKQFASTYLEALQENHGNVWFASADWADGWKGFIDGAFEQGAFVAQKVADAFRHEKDGAGVNGKVDQSP